ncbi:MAG: DASS family sodium-coupled anion symporter [Planctomycetes bacterium]|nr:DASS family sodium-coupled anion symporter [Planctomycetota bacterium]
MGIAVRRAALVLGPALWLAFAVFDTPLARALGSNDAARAAGLALWMATWWLAEAVPMAWTACLPLVVLPGLPLASQSHVEALGACSKAYLDAYVFLFLGGLAIAAALERWNLHRRLALFVLARVGTSPPRLCLGVLASTAFVSMWISNTASAALMLPIALALVRELEGHAGGRRLDRFGCALVLAVAYGANLGGMGTKIGTAPNAQLVAFLEREADRSVSFLQFSAFGLPFVLLMLPATWFVLWRLGRSDAPSTVPTLASIREERRRLGAWNPGERAVASIFAGTAALWIASAPLTQALRAFGAPAGLRGAHVEAGVAVLALLVLLLARPGGRPLLPIRELKHLSWGTLLLLGGSLALADALQSGGLAAIASERLGSLGSWPLLPAAIAAALLSVALSAVASNTATVAVLLPVLWQAAPPERAIVLVAAATLAASCDFALPVGTPPNAIVFGSGYVTVPRMARAGVALDLLAALLCGLWCAATVGFLL